MPPLRAGVDVVDALRRERGVAAWSSWKFVLPPSMIVSPGARCSRSSSIWASVASPAGTMIQTARGFSSLLDQLGDREGGSRPRPRSRVVFSGVRL